MRSPTLLKYEIIDVFCVKKYTFKPKNVVSFWGGLRSPYLLPGSSPDPLPGFRPWTPRGLQSPDLPLLWSPKKILKLYSA